MRCTIVFQKNWEAINAVLPDGRRQYKYIINEGSSRSSKTISLIDCYDLYARSNENKRMTVWRDTKTDCKKTVLNDVLKHLKKTGRYKVRQDFNKTESIFTYSTDSTFEIHGTDDEETVHGLTQDCAWLNEPYKISKDTFDQIDQRTSDFIFIDWNPKKAHWIDDIKKDPRCLVIHSTFKDNPFCPEEQRAKILSYQPVSMCDAVISGLLRLSDAYHYDVTENKLRLTNKQINELVRCIQNELQNSASEFNWSVYGLGLKAERPNRIFNWGEIPLQQYFDLKVNEYHASDWGVVDPWGILSGKYYDGALYLRQRNYDSENIIKGKLTAQELSQINSVDEGLVTWYFNRLGINKDSYIVCDPNRPMKIMALRASGYDYSISALKPPGSIIDGISGLCNMKVYYTSDSLDLKYEQENYSRQVDRYGIVLEEPEDVDNHLMDCARYLYQFLKREGIIKNI